MTDRITMREALAGLLAKADPGTAKAVTVLADGLNGLLARTAALEAQLAEAKGLGALQPAGDQVSPAEACTVYVKAPDGTLRHGSIVATESLRRAAATWPKV